MLSSAVEVGVKEETGVVRAGQSVIIHGATRRLVAIEDERLHIWFAFARR